MKAIRIVVVMVAAVVMLANVADAQISATLHNFSTNGWSVGSQICGPCHTPHNAMTNAPLWAHTLSSETNYTVYSSSTMNVTPGQPGAESAACLSCHDGTVALNAYVGGPGGGATISGSADLGTDLSDDHPISFAYATSRAADSGIHNETNNVPQLSGTIANTMLFSGQMQCSSCHDPHGTGVAKLLRFSNSGSALCLTCHNK